MEKKALEGAYLLAYFKKQNKYDYDKYKDMIIEVTDIGEDIFNFYYQVSIDFLQRKTSGYKLNTSLRNMISDFEESNQFNRYEYKINNYAEEYFKQIEMEYLLNGENFVRIYDYQFDENDQVQLYMSIVTKNIVKHDNIMLGQEEPYTYKNQNYRPYFTEFVSDYIDKEDFYKLKLDENSNDNQWRKINFVADEYKGKNPCISGTFLFSTSYLQIDKRKIEIINCEEIPEEVKNFKLYLKYIKNNVFDNKRRNELNNELKKIFPISYKECEISIFDVGQGSFNLIEMDDKKFIFDVGCSRYKEEQIEIKDKECSNELIKNIKPNCVILSHWDLDHILGITNMTDNIFDAYWIVPDISDIPQKNKFSDSAKRLLCFLGWYNKTKLISISSNKQGGMNNTVIFSNEVFELGKGSASTYNSKISSYLCGQIKGLGFQNNFGLLLKIKGNKKQIIFPGDCEYYAFPYNFMTELPDYLVVPHHGSKMIFDDIHMNILYKKRCSPKRKLAFISAGKNNYSCKYRHKEFHWHDDCSCEYIYEKFRMGDCRFKYRQEECNCYNYFCKYRHEKCSSHPHSCHIKFLSKLGYKIHTTSSKGDYKFKLN